MRVRYVGSDKLPDDVAVALVAGDHAASVLINVRASASAVAEALQAIVPPWVEQEWMHVGTIEPHLRAI